MPQRIQLVQVEAEARKHHLHCHPRHRRHEHMPRAEHALDDGVRPIARSPLPTNPEVPQLVPDPYRMSPGAPLHRGVVTLARGTLIASVPAHHLAGP